MIYDTDICTWRFEKCHGLHKFYIWPQQLGDDRKDLEENRKGNVWLLTFVEGGVTSKTRLHMHAVDHK